MPAQTFLNRRRNYYVVGALMLIASVAATTGFTLFYLRTNAVQRELEVAAVYAREVEGHLTQSLNVVDLTLAGIAEVGSGQRPSSKSADLLQFALKNGPYLRSIGVLDEQGRIEKSSTPQNIGLAVDTSRYFPEAAADVEVLRVGSPVFGRDFFSLDQANQTFRLNPFIPLHRSVRVGARLTRLVAALNVDYFINHYSSVLPPDKSTLTILRYDGLPLMGTRELPSGAAPVVFRQTMAGLAHSEIGQFQEASAFGGESLTAYRASRHYPFIVVVQIDKDAALLEWQSQAKTNLVLIGLVLTGTLLVLLLSYLVGERAERERLAALERQRLSSSVFDSSLEAILITDADARIVSVNPAFTSITGFRADEVLGKNPSILGSGCHSSEFYAAFWKKLHQDGQWQGEITNKRKDGSLFTEWLVVTRVLNSHGQCVNYVGVFSDISEAKRAENELRLAAATFETQEGVMITDPDARIIRVNRAFTETTGYQAAEVIGRTPAILKSGRHDSSTYAQMRTDLATKGMWQGEIWNRRKNGDIYPEWLTITAVRGRNDTLTHYVATFSDITKQKKAEDEIKLLAFYDSLTGLPNRRLLMERLRQAMASTRRNRQHGALLFIDLDHFKYLNDTLGHEMGDRLLCLVATRLTGAVRDGDTVARLGGDEFVIMLEDLGESAQLAASHAESIAEKILSTFEEPFQLGTQDYHSSPSIGISLFYDHESSVEEAIRRADVAMYQAKSSGRNRVCFFDPEMQLEIEARLQLEDELRTAIAGDQLELFYQIQVDKSGRPSGCEALIRWHHPTRGLLEPASFVPLAVDCGLIIPLGRWVVTQACRQLSLWSTIASTRSLVLAININAKEFRQEDFVSRLLDEIAKAGINPARLKLELTESVLVEDIDEAVAKMAQLRLHGLKFSLDDFGTGYSSLAYLKQLPIDQVKIDKSFVVDILDNENEAAISRTILALGHSMGLEVIAEGVETAAQRDFLAAAGCDAFQGFLFSEPVANPEFLAWLDAYAGKPAA